MLNTMKKVCQVAALLLVNGFLSHAVGAEIQRSNKVQVPANVIQLESVESFLRLYPQHPFIIRSMRTSNFNAFLRGGQQPLLFPYAGNELPYNQGAKGSYKLNDEWSLNLLGNSGWRKAGLDPQHNNFPKIAQTKVKNWGDIDDPYELYSADGPEGNFLHYLPDAGHTYTLLPGESGQGGWNFFYVVDLDTGDNWYANGDTYLPDEYIVYTDGSAHLWYHEFQFYRVNTDYPEPIAYYPLETPMDICNEMLPGNVDCATSVVGTTITTNRLHNSTALLFYTDTSHVTLPGTVMDAVSEVKGEYTLSFWIRRHSMQEISSKSVNPIDWNSMVTINGRVESPAVSVGIVGLGGAFLSDGHVNSVPSVALSKASNSKDGLPTNWMRPLQAPIQPRDDWAHVVIVQNKHDMYVYIDSEQQEYGELNGCKYEGQSGQAWPLVYYSLQDVPEYVCGHPGVREMVGQQYPFLSPLAAEQKEKLGVTDIENVTLGSRTFFDPGTGHTVSTKPILALSELLIFNSALTPQQVAALHSDQLVERFWVTKGRYYFPSN